MSRLFPELKKAHIQMSLVACLTKDHSDWNAILLNQFIRQQHTDMPFFETQLNKTIALSNLNFHLCVRACPATYDQLLRMNTMDSNILMLCVDEFSQNDISKKIQSIKASLQTNCSIIIVKIDEEKSVPLSNEEKSWISEQGFASASLSIKQFAETNQLFKEAITKQLKLSGLNDSETDTAFQKLTEGFVESAANEAEAETNHNKPADHSL